MSPPQENLRPSELRRAPPRFPSILGAALRALLPRADGLRRGCGRPRGRGGSADLRAPARGAHGVMARSSGRSPPPRRRASTRALPSAAGLGSELSAGVARKGQVRHRLPPHTRSLRTGGGERHSGRCAPTPARSLAKLWPRARSARPFECKATTHRGRRYPNEFTFCHGGSSFKFSSLHARERSRVRAASIQARSAPHPTGP